MMIFSIITALFLLTSQVAQSQFDDALAKRRSGDIDSSIILFEKILTREIDFPNKVFCYIQLGDLCWDAGDLPRSLSYYQKAYNGAKHANLSEYQTHAFLAMKINEYYQQAKIFRTKQDFESAINSFDIAIKYSRELKSPDHEIKCLRQQSNDFLSLNKLDNFYQVSSSALELARKINLKREIASCLNNLGLYFWRIDFYSEAIQRYEECLRLAKEIKNIITQSDCMTNLGCVYRDIGALDKAYEYFIEALNIDIEMKNESQIGTDYLNLGAIFKKRWQQTNEESDYEQEMEYFFKSLEHARKNNNVLIELSSLNNIGTAFSDTQEYERALDYFNESLALAEKNKEYDLIINVLNNLGTVQYNLENFENANFFFSRALALANENKNSRVLWETYYEMGNSEVRQGQNEAAIADYGRSISVIEHVRSNLRSEDDKATYMGSGRKIEPYQSLIHALLNASIDNIAGERRKEAFNILERARARAFLDSLEVAAVDLSRGVDPRLASQEKEAMREISGLYGKLLMPGLAEEERTIISVRIKDAEDRLESIVREIRATSPAYANLQYPNIMTFDQASRMFGDNRTTYIAFSLGKLASYAFALKKADLKVYALPPREQLQARVAAYRRTLADKDVRDFSAGDQLFRALIEPALSPGVDRLVIIPDDILYFLPFEALPTNKGDSPRWLIQDYSISYAPSFSSLRELRLRRKRASSRSKDFLAFGDPYYGPEEESERLAPLSDILPAAGASMGRLRFASREIESVRREFTPSRSDVFLRLQASEDRLKSIPLNQYKILHFATHALIDGQKPARSSIILSLGQGGPEDGLLQTRDILDLKLNADLVTLSACQSGLGQLIRGEGIEGLNRAFFYAGASAVLMSLWSVNDEATFRLMDSFYRHLREGGDPAGSLRLAKLEILREPSLSHPFDWAGFILTGVADRPLFPRFPAVPVTAGILLVVILAIWFRGRGRGGTHGKG